VGFFAQIGAVLWLAVYFGHDSFLGGQAIAVLTPPLAVAVDGFSSLLRDLSELIEALLLSATRLRRSEPPTLVELDIEASVSSRSGTPTAEEMGHR
jgi:hypothetical protein